MPNVDNYVICSKHFSNDCFEADLEVEYKFVAQALGRQPRRKLKINAIPNVFPEEYHLAMGSMEHDGEEDEWEDCEVSSSATGQPQNTEKEDCSDSPHIICQCQAPTTSTSSAMHLVSPASSITPPTTYATGAQGGRKSQFHRGTQASFIRPHVRSKGINVCSSRQRPKPVMLDAGVQCTMCQCKVPHSDSELEKQRCSSPIPTASDSHQFSDHLPAPPQFTSPIPVAPEQVFNTTVESLQCESLEEDADYNPDTAEAESYSILDNTQRSSISGSSEQERCETERQAAFQERKYIVFQSSLLKLFQTCPCCHSRGCVDLLEAGTLLQVAFVCKNCSHAKTWNSQPFIGQMPVGNLQLSASILISGSVPSKTFGLLDAMNIAHQCESTYYRHQRSYVQPTIVNVWMQQQAAMLQELSTLNGLILAADGRSDSPGHCAKFGGLNTMECQINKVIDVQVVQSNEVGNSARCENEGMRRMFRFLQENNLHTDIIITDRHKQNEKYLRENHRNTTHFFDVWHVAKGLTKKLTSLASKRGMEKISTWRKSIVNHLHWVATSTRDGNGEMMLAKWESLLNHVVDQHDGHGGLFPTCQHGQLDIVQRENKDWFVEGTEEYVALRNVLENTYLLKDIKKLSPIHQTSTLEAFHSLIVNFCPKSMAFSYMGMYCRLYIAAMHYNENAERGYQVDSEGQTKVKIIFPKAKKGDYSIRKLKEKPTHNYVNTLLTYLFAKYTENPAALKASLPQKFQETPDPLSSQYEHPTAEEARATYTARFDFNR